MQQDERTPEETPSAEASRKTTGSRAFVFVAAITVVALIALVGTLAYRRVAAQSAARDDVAEARDLIGSVDDTIKRVDDLVRAQATSSLSEEIAEVLESIPRAKLDAKEARTLLTDAAPSIGREEREAVLDAADAANLRVDLLDAGEPLLEATGKASRAIGPAEDGWKLLISAEKLSDKAASLYNAHDKKKTEESRKLTKQATEEVRQARAMFDMANQAMPEAGLAPVLAYCDGRLELLVLADKADAAFLGGKISEANTISKSYNAKEKELTAQAKKLPQSPSAAISAAYERITEESSKRYELFRQRLTNLQPSS